jgi:Lipoxygenase
MVMETVAVAMHRQPSVTHPIHQLLVPHCRFTMAINHAARTKMLAPDGPIDKTMSVGRDGALALCARGWKEWSFAQYDLRKDLRSRGVDDAALLPGYHYRDDALKVWDVIAAFVGDVVRSFYRTDDDVAGAPELQALALELANKEIGDFRDFADRGIATVDQLAQIATTLVFIAPPSIRAPIAVSTTCTHSFPTFPDRSSPRPPQARRDSRSEACSSPCRMLSPRRSRSEWSIC